MFRSAVSLVTASAVLWHVVGGCCMHHGHGEASEPSADTPPAHSTPPAPRCGCCKHQARTSEPRMTMARLTMVQPAETRSPMTNDSSPAENVPFTPCHGDKCVFAIAKIVSANQLTVVRDAFGGSSIANVTDSADRNSITALTDAEIKPPPLRRHLALRILLI